MTTSTVEAIRHQAAAAGSRTRELIAAVRLVRARAAAEHEALEVELRRELDALADDLRGHAADCLVIAAEALPELRDVATAYDGELFGVPAASPQPQPAAPTEAEAWADGTFDAPVPSGKAWAEAPPAEVQVGKPATADESESVEDLLPPTPEEAVAAYDAADAVPLPPGRVQEIIDYVGKHAPPVSPQDYASAAEALAAEALDVGGPERKETADVVRRVLGEEDAPAEDVAAAANGPKPKKARRRR